MTTEIQKDGLTVFEQIRRTDISGNEYWNARDLAKVLEYSEYRHFIPAIERAREACKNSGQTLVDHFEHYLDMIETGKTIRELGVTMPENLPAADSLKKIEHASTKLPAKTKRLKPRKEGNQ